MKTAELIDMLAKGAVEAAPAAFARRYGVALGVGVGVSALLMATWLRLLPNLDEAATWPMFWTKAAFAGGVTGAGLWATLRLSRPGGRAGESVAVGLGALGLIWLIAAAQLMGAPPEQRMAMWLGRTWTVCPTNIAILSAPVFVAVFWAMRGLAPTRLRLAGAAGGLLAGASGAATYSLHCPEMAAPFIATWYVIGILIPTALGALLGPRLLRW